MELVAEGHNTGDKDFTAQIMKMQTEQIDCALIWTHDPELAIHARQIYELGLECQVVSSPGITMSQVLGMVESDYVEGWYGVTDFVSTSTDENVVNFIENFKFIAAINSRTFHKFIRNIRIYILTDPIYHNRSCKTRHNNRKITIQQS